MYAEIIVNAPVEGTFHYHIPAELAGHVNPGHLVEVVFGQQRAQGVVLRLDIASPVETTKPVLSLIDREPVVTEDQLRLAEWLSATYLTPLAQCVKLFIPPGISKRGDVLISPQGDLEQIQPGNETQARLLKLLAQRGPMRGRQIEHAMPRRNWQAAAAQLSDMGAITRQPILDLPSVSPKTVRVAECAFPPDRVEAVIAQYLKPDTSSVKRRASLERRADILRVLARERQALDVSQIYVLVPGSSLSDLRALAEDDLLVFRQAEQWRDPLEGIAFLPDSPPQLTADQAAAWSIISKALTSDRISRPFLLHGVTGSGKTELYLRAVEQVLAQGRSAIVLVPEIALTPQTVRRFGARFPGRMGLIHSELSPGERYDTWRRARSGQFDVVIGPRSALFTPMRSLGLVVIDECHDDSYKQSPPIVPPYYHAVPTAIEMAREQAAVVLMGSATPSIVMYAHATRPGDPNAGDYTLLELPGRIMGHRRAIEVQAMRYQISQTRYRHEPSEPEEAVMVDLPPVHIVDMRRELRAGNRSIFSRLLLTALEETLSRNEQAILFLNRRGSATYVFCRSCGHVLKCPRCGIPLTWHSVRSEQGEEQGVLVCHHCNYRGYAPERCPECRSEHIRYFGGGTERIEEEVSKRFPGIRAVRWDRDTTTTKGSHDALLQQFMNRQANVLIGTQMIAKGLDLPLVTLVGVVSADTALYLPDYRSGERTFQLLTQVAGRAGRGLLGGKVILQTYDPDHYAIQAAAEHDFHRFYAQEIAYRQKIGYPPFNRLVRLLIRADTNERARRESTTIYRRLAQRIAEERLVSTSLIGPAPAFYAKLDQIFRWHIVIRGPNPSALVDDLQPSSRLHIDIDPISLL